MLEPSLPEFMGDEAEGESLTGLDALVPAAAELPSPDTACCGSLSSALFWRYIVCMRAAAASFSLLPGIGYSTMSAGNTSNSTGLICMVFRMSSLVRPMQCWPFSITISSPTLNPASFAHEPSSAFFTNTRAPGCELAFLKPRPVFWTSAGSTIRFVVAPAFASPRCIIFSMSKGGSASVGTCLGSEFDLEFELFCVAGAPFGSSVGRPWALSSLAEANVPIVPAVPLVPIVPIVATVPLALVVPIVPIVPISRLMSELLCDDRRNMVWIRVAATSCSSAVEGGKIIMLPGSTDKYAGRLCISSRMSSLVRSMQRKPFNKMISSPTASPTWSAHVSGSTFFKRILGFG
mmetsp:Transcript_51140/g.129063  ORF Transcript_51140/g.129063 Transcript_51140/m.129063 type:complete len:348 (-) Transcript_51140:639-1682(-)